MERDTALIEWGVPLGKATALAYSSASISGYGTGALELLLKQHLCSSISLQHSKKPLSFLCSPCSCFAACVFFFDGSIVDYSVAPNGVIHERQDGVWFQSDSSVVFQHADISTMSELVEVFLYNLGGGFMEIRKVGYRFLQRQPNGRFVHFLVWLFNDDHIRITFGCHRRLMPQHVMNFLVEVGGSPSGPPVAATPVRIPEPPAPETEVAMDNSESDDSDYATSTGSSSDVQEGGERGADTPAARCPHYIFPAPPPIPRLEYVPCVNHVTICMQGFYD
ncbi:hypothetical protein PIB30_087691 [Stylosanthes scabra]|uniref:Uncharacterized protein n=1 Tax=Stylosanthes scabra TaxID=79078 RepID=A0ABU6ZS66_9FABA|nr:hypothetical protein [Stylosanthes scabra]